MPDREDGRGLGGQPVQPFVGGHRLAGRRVVAEAAPVAFGLDRLVRDGSLDDQDERVEFAPVGLVPPLDEVVGALLGAALEVDQRPVHGDLGQPRQGAERDLLDAGLGRGGQCHRVPVAAEAPVHPEDMYDWLLRGLGHSATPSCRRPVMGTGAPGQVMRDRDAGRRDSGRAADLEPAPGSRRCMLRPPSRPRAGTARTGRCGFAGPRETILGVPQWVTGEMRRRADRSLHAHNGPAHGNRAITGTDRLFLSS